MVLIGDGTDALFVQQEEEEEKQFRAKGRKGNTTDSGARKERQEGKKENIKKAQKRCDN